MSKILHIPDVKLSGLQMIEASAGTGKTWTIAALYLRLLLERALPVEKILVVTYTNAATAELRARIRLRLVEAQQACVAGDAGEDEVLQDIFKRVKPAQAQVLLTLALESFDLAAIHTIHGFCQRALAERAFESGMAFDSELARDDRRVLHEAVEDFWRREIVSNDDPVWLGWLLAQLPGPAVLLQQLSAQFGKPYLLLVPAPPVDEKAGLNFAATFSRVQSLWAREGDAAIAQLLEHPGMNQTSHKPGQIRAAAEACAAWLQGSATLPMPEVLERLSARKLTEKTKKGNTPPEHIVFAALEELLDAALAAEAAFAAKLGHLLQRALAECEANVRAARQRSATRSFDDLLLDLHAALQSEGGPLLAEALRQRYAAALIDEFQDTDPLQYEIFAQIFSPQPVVETVAAVPVASGQTLSLFDEVAPASAPQSGLLIFVGDPKQAIYSFRGADLRAYMQARQQAGDPLVLNTNRRSTAELIAVVNTLFGQSPRPFLDEDLAFEKVQAPDTAPAPILLDGKPLPALDLGFMPRG
ncbi:MAG TPA: UvrD-helicase domain-containing protein [Rhodocyclaceae bacterium]|nr:UvrD-helicase domain-containing protein [Rhodocyclaceae bacterium]